MGGCCTGSGRHCTGSGRFGTGLSRSRTAPGMGFPPPFPQGCLVSAVFQGKSGKNKGKTGLFRPIFEGLWKAGKGVIHRIAEGRAANLRNPTWFRAAARRKVRSACFRLAPKMRNASLLLTFPTRNSSLVSRGSPDLMPFAMAPKSTDRREHGDPMENRGYSGSAGVSSAFLRRFFLASSCLAERVVSSLRM